MNDRPNNHFARPAADTDRLPDTERTKTNRCDWFADGVTEALQRRWIEDPPTQKCFDQSEARAEALLSFIEDTADARTFDDVRIHLLECARCRFIYASARETGEHCISHQMSECMSESPQAQIQEIPKLLRDNLRSTGPVVFPGGQLAD